MIKSMEEEVKGKRLRLRSPEEADDPDPMVKIRRARLGVLRFSVAVDYGGDGEKQSRHICSYCDKMFSSGKVLHAHMMIHLTRDRNGDPAAKIDNRGADGGAGNAQIAETSEATCSVCRKRFPSMKSLFGHMRCHPDRQWRGINPPHKPTAAAADLSQSVVSWPVTGKRGRKGPAAGSASAPEQQIVDDLLMLGRRTDSGDREVGEATNSNSPTNGAGGEYCNLEKQSKRKRKKKKKKRLTDLDKNYRCSSCNRTFWSHQALGGHKASHNKHSSKNKNMMVQSTVDHESAISTQLVVAMEDQEEDDDQASAVVHECKICNKSFSSGQALGGHKRCHWTGSAPALSSQVTSAGEDSPTAQKNLSFDLNYPPPLDQEEEGIDSSFFFFNMHHIVPG